MVDENESAFAVYSGKVSPSKGQKRRKKNKEKKNIDVPLTMLEKLEIIRKKKEKKNKIILNGRTNLDDSLSNTNKEKKLKRKYIFENMNALEGKKKLKKKSKKIKPKVTDEDVSSDIITPNYKGLVESVASNQNQVHSESDNSVIPPVDATYSIVYKREKKIKKKVQISSDLPPRKKDGLKKVVISTPRFKRKAESSDNFAKNNVLNAVDSYIKKNQENPSNKLIKKNKKSTMLETLAWEAKEKAEKQGSGETFGEATLQKILEPVSVELFLKDHWEKKPMHIPGKEKKFSSFLSTEMIDTVLRENTLLFGKHIDVTTYTNGQRETHNPEGRAHAHIVWDFYSNDCSVRLLNPQFFFNTIHLLNSHLQEIFGCFVGANVYLTPPNSQGFAPHYDDIEAIILQVEGVKIWRIYAPFTKEGHLPRFSSRNLSDAELGEPIMEVTLKAGDVLYFPRGFIHQGRTEEQHSLHITLSTYQQTSWFNLLEKALPLTLEKACKQDVEFRKGLPLGYLESAGFAYTNSTQKKKFIVSHLKNLIKRMVDFIEVDEAMDAMGLKFMEESLPPVFTPKEAACSVFGGGIRMGKNGKISHHVNFTLDTNVRWIRKYCFRVVEEGVTTDNDLIERQVRIYYNLDNSREYKKEEPQFIIIPPGYLPGVLHLVSAYPEYTKISDLPKALDEEDKITLVGDLWDRGLLVTQAPLEVASENEQNTEVKEVLSKEEEEVFADLLDAVPLGEDNQENTSDSDEELDDDKIENSSVEQDDFAAEQESDCEVMSIDVN